MKRVATAVLVVLMLATLAHARTKEGVTMPDEVVLEGKKVVLNGMGLREATALNVDVYVAGLYLENKSSDGRAIAESNETKRLVLRFVRDVDGDDISSAWTEGFKKNSAAAVPALQARINKLNGWMQDVEDGQSLVFNYIPGKGLQVIVDGAKKGFIEGEDFQKAFFLIFLGDPPNAGLKSGLLGK
ncbi:MAG: hypothetical protein AMXMBFR64_20500 [Myxococcales bacterium]